MIPASYFCHPEPRPLRPRHHRLFHQKRPLTQFMAVEIMLNAANLAFLALAESRGFLDAQVIVFFIITVAAAEAADRPGHHSSDLSPQEKSIKTEDIGFDERLI